MQKAAGCAAAFLCLGLTLIGATIERHLHLKALSEEVEDVQQNDNEQRYAQQPCNNALHRNLQSCFGGTTPEGAGWFRGRGGGVRLVGEDWCAMNAHPTQGRRGSGHLPRNIPSYDGFFAISRSSASRMRRW